MKRDGNKNGAILCAAEFLFFCAYAGSAFVAAYLKEAGFSPLSVGAAMAAVNCAGVLAAPVMGGLSDKLGSARRVLILCVASQALLLMLLPAAAAFAPLAAGALLLVWAFFRNPTTSLADSWIVAGADQFGNLSYGTVRLFGSFSGATMCLLYGIAASKSGTQSSAFFIGGVFAAGFVALSATLGRRVDGGAPFRGGAKGGVRAALSSRPLRVFLLAHAAMGLPMFCLTSFLPDKLVELTGVSSALGLLIALKSYAEMPTLLFGARLEARFGAKNLIFVALSAFFVEHVVCALARSVALVAAMLVFHGLFFGLYTHCAVRYVYALAPEGAGASAQSLAASVALFSAVLGNLACGALVTLFGSGGFFFTAAALFLAALGVLAFGRPGKTGRDCPDAPGAI